MKHCSKCGQEKPLEQFSADRRRADGKRANCKPCAAQARIERAHIDKPTAAKYRAANLDKVKATAARHYQATKAQTGPKKAAYLRAWYKQNPQIARDYRAKRRMVQRQATPQWSDPQAVRQIYEVAVVLSRGGVRFEVDHIVPLRHALVSGLHCETNLRVIPRHQNTSKGNRYWPEMP
jgi:hypothetical protein